MNMLDLIEQHRGQIEALCREYGVKRLELFGSAARGDFKSNHSDVDFMVEFLSDDWRGVADQWFGLQEGLEALLGHKVDMVDVKAARNPFFLQVANRHKVQLYAA
jgi:predicted nucleotidyltransferase